MALCWVRLCGGDAPPPADSMRWCTTLRVPALTRETSVVNYPLRFRADPPGRGTECAGHGPLAQLAEQGTFNPKVAGSRPARPTNRIPGPHRLAAKDSALSRRQQGFEFPWGHHKAAGRATYSHRWLSSFSPSAHHRCEIPHLDGRYPAMLLIASPLPSLTAVARPPSPMTGNATRISHIHQSILERNHPTSALDARISFPVRPRPRRA